MLIMFSTYLAMVMSTGALNLFYLAYMLIVTVITAMTSTEQKYSSDLHPQVLEF